MTQKFVDIEKIDLLNKTLDMKNTGCRLAQICAVNDGSPVLLYSFIKGEELISLRFKIEASEPVESISCLYSYAFLYENEMKDLFGINILNMNLDFNGHFYETTVKTPFAPVESEVKQDG